MLKAGFSNMRKLGMLALTGLILIVIARLWHPVHPIIKHIWTGSFVLYSGGICYLLLAFFYLMTDMTSFKGWAKGFIIIGTNSIVAYTAWHLFDFGLVSDVFTNGLKPYTGNWYPLIRSTGAFAVLFLILRYMYVKRIFIKI